MASSSSAPQNRTSVSPELPPQFPPTPSFKNSLIMFAQRSNMRTPEFHSRNEGPDHAPAYRSSVMVDELMFTSHLTFFHRKAADQEVARIALDYLVKKVKEDAYSIIGEVVTFCKSTLNEYATKLNIRLPTYNSVAYNRVIPYFVCTVDLNGTSYTGDAARRKRDAEDLAARAAILSILGNSDSGVMLAQMIKGKAKLFDSAKPKTLQATGDSVPVLPVENSAHSSGHLQQLDDTDKVKDVADPVGNDNTLQPARDGAIVSCMENSAHSRGQLQLLDGKDKDKDVADLTGTNDKNTMQPTRDSVIVSPMEISAHSCGHPQLLDAKDKDVTDPVGNDNINEIEMVRPESEPIISTSQQPEMQTHEPTPEAAKSLNDSQQPSAALPNDSALSGKRRRRQNYKANKKARRMEAQLKAVNGNSCMAQ